MVQDVVQDVDVEEVSLKDLKQQQQQAKKSKGTEVAVQVVAEPPLQQQGNKMITNWTSVTTTSVTPQDPRPITNIPSPPVSAPLDTLITAPLLQQVNHAFHMNDKFMEIIGVVIKDKDKKKGNQNAGKPGFPGSKGKSNTNSKAAAKNTRITGRSQRGS